MLRFRNAVVLLLFAGAVFFAPATPARACSCAAATYEEHVARADAVFDGIAKKLQDPEGESSQPISSGRPVTYTFDVTGPVKSTVPDPVEVVTPADGASCGAGFTLGEEYRVFVKRNEGNSLTTNLCMGNIKSSDAPKITTTTVAAKPTATTPKPGVSTTTTTALDPTTTSASTTTTSEKNAVTINESSDGGSGWVVPVAIGAIALAGLAGFAAYQRSRRTDPAHPL